jgi:fumarate reductase subunit D
VSARRSNKPAPVQEAQRRGEKVTRSSGFEWLARAGFVARGVVYAIIGVLAVELALGAGGKATNQQGPLRTIARQPLGKVLLILVAIGLGGYALWRLLHGLLGHGPESSDSSLDRIAALASGIVYGGLCAIAVEILLGSSSKGSGNAPRTTAGVLGWPGGSWLVGIAGGVLIGVGLYQGYRGVSRDFLEHSKTERMSAWVRPWFEWIGVLGHVARMVVFGLVGVFLVKAAVDLGAQQAVGLGDARYRRISVVATISRARDALWRVRAAPRPGAASPRPGADDPVASTPSRHVTCTCS